jgi:Response regulator containing a CheY-like receiver domain and an HTH DNA-binding domain
MPTRILLADDHMMMRQGLRQILEHEADFAVVAEAGSGLEAIEQAQEHRPDVVVMDIAMKELNGIEAATQIGSASRILSS